MDLPQKFQIHYHLLKESHSLDAFVKNKCEAEFLAVAIEVAEILGVELTLESEALLEGGIREIWSVLGKNSAQIALVISTLALIWSVVPQSDKELLDLQKQETRLSIEERKLEIEKLKKELKKVTEVKDAAKAAATISNGSYKVVTRKSNFYKTLATCKKVYQVGFVELDREGKPLDQEKIVSKEFFDKFILTSNELSPLEIDSARIEIVAPVLKEGKAKWKGIYENEYISFSMEDNDFKQAVLSKQISFKNGSEIICALLKHRKVDELGDIVASGYVVDVVLENVESGTSTEMPQGRRYRHTKKLLDSQEEMFGRKGD
jgi:hypothetical protein